MKKIDFLLAFIFAIVTGATAQECKLCGTWEGIYTMTVPDPNPDGDIVEEPYKMVVRINSYGTDATIRVKSIPTKDPSNVRYWSDCDVTYYNGNLIKWISYIRTSYDWDCSDRKNGKVVHSVIYTWHGTAEFSNGRLSFSYYMHSSYKDKSGNEIGTHDNPAKKITMYKDEGDW